MHSDVFLELSLIFAITVVITSVVKFLKQPAIIGYIFSGIIAGPYFFNIINSTDTLSAFSQIGIALLLFLVGLGLNPKVVKEVGLISAITGIGQVVFTSGVGFLILITLGFDTVSSIYLSIALAFSSTIVIMKLLSDKKELDSLHGKISVGFLIIQDFIAIFILLIVSTLSSSSNLSTALLETTLFGILIGCILVFLSIFVLPVVTKYIANSQDLLLLFSIAWCFLIASIFYYFKFSVEAGALIAGITLSTSPYHIEISSRLKPLRDFFLVLFFILLGSHMVFSNVYETIFPIILLSLFVLIGNPIIVMILMGLFGYTKRISFLSGLTVAQISEFSLILVTMGVAAGHIQPSIVSTTTAIGLLTFIGSSYMILYSQPLYKKLSPFISVFEKNSVKNKKYNDAKSYLDQYDVVLFGYNRIGFDILNTLNVIKANYLVVDFNPKVISLLTQKEINCLYGDANDIELLSELNFAKCKLVVSTIPNVETNLSIIKKVNQENPRVSLTMVAHQIKDAVTLYKAGATYVIMPHFLGGKQFADYLKRNKNLNKTYFLTEKKAHLKNIKMRLAYGHEHPVHL